MPVLSRLIVPLALAAATAGAAVASPSPEPRPDRPRDQYRIDWLAPVAGASSSGTSVNNRGQVAGYSDAVDGGIHAAVWRRGEPRDLGTLGGQGSSSAVLWPNKSERGVVVGITQTDRPDPNNEPWSCSFFLPARPGFACVGFVWRDGEMEALPTLGGTHGFATGINNRNQIVGWAENTVVDDSCTQSSGQVLQFRAVRWDRLGRRTTELLPLRGDRVSAATAINDRGRVVGISGLCDQAVGRLSARDAVVWDRGRGPRRLADLGGVAWNTPMSLNRRGDIAGFLNRSRADGTDLAPMPAWWTTSGRLHPLDLPQGYTFGQALGINSRRDVVGVALSSDFTRCTAMLWRDDRPIKLNRITRGPAKLCIAGDINDRGQIAGEGTHPETGARVGFLLERVRR